MEKNIAALLREDTRTVRVSFDQVAEEFDEVPEAPSPSNARRTLSTSPAKPPNSKLYTYVTDLALGVGDLVVVEARGMMALAFVREVDGDVAIEPSDQTRFKWIMAKVDLTGYNANAARNAEIEQAVSAAYKNNLRRSFAANILAGLDDAHRGQIAALLGAAK